MRLIRPDEPAGDGEVGDTEVGDTEVGAVVGGTSAPAGKRRPLYPRLLRLRHIRPNAWQRALLGEGALAVAVVLVLADLATAWTLLVLPLAVAGVVKAHDALAGLLRSPRQDGPAI